MKKIIFLFTVYLLSYFQLHSQVSFKTGVNFPFRSKETASIDSVLYRLFELQAPAIRYMTFADAYWKNVEPSDNAWNFTYPDSAYFNPYGIIPVGILFSNMGPLDTIGIQPPWEACNIPSVCYWDVLDDSIETKDYLQTVVSRYQSVTSYWEISNEFEHVNKPKGLASNGNATLSQVTFLRSVSQWIKEIQPDAMVLNPGLVGTYDYPFERSIHWLDTIFSLGGTDAFDVVNYHDYNSWWTLPAHYDSIQNVLTKYNLQKPIWITESSISSVNLSPITPDYSSSDEQAADVWRRICLLWAKGAQVVFWHSFWSSGDLNSWGEFGLLNQDGYKKKSYHSYNLLLQKVADHDSVQLIQTGLITEDNQNGGAGVWVIQFWKNNIPKWLIWSPDNQPYTLTNVNANQIVVTHVVPSQLFNNGDSAVFMIDTLPVVNQSVIFNDLTSLPILIESDIVNNLAHNPKENIKVFPNPVTKYLFIDMDNNEIKDTYISLFDIQGIKIGTWKNQEKINIANYKSGIYFLTIMTEDNIITQRIIKL